MSGEQGADARNYAGIIEAIERTGFPLEHRTACAFIKQGWSIVANKYYVDDNSGEAREIDLIAYKVANLDAVRVYSAVIISCKKTSENTWVFMTRPINAADPNKDLAPLHYWTNDKALNYSMSRPGFAKEYTDRLARSASFTWGLPDEEVFAFQELWPSRNGRGECMGYKPGNDRALFSSVTSLMKAQAYELGRLPERRRETVLYVFSLLAVMEGDLLAAHFRGDSAEVKKKDEFRYIAHYIINKKEQFSRINFTHSDRLSEVIKEYDSAHRSSVALIKKSISDFYKTVLSDKNKRRVLSDIVVSKVKVWANIFGKLAGDHRMDLQNTVLGYEENSNTVVFQIANSAPEDRIDKLNSIDNVVSMAKKTIKEVYKHEVNVRFEHDIPF